MKKIHINGSRALSGSISVSGSKNAALPIIFACILTDGVSDICNLPDIGDVRVALKILDNLGAVVTRLDNHTYIDTRTLTYSPPDPRLISKIRASTYLIGSCLVRFSRCEIMNFGGCNFSARPIDMHLDACRALGAEISDRLITAKGLVGAEISFKKKSVGATVNAILLASCAKGSTTIRGYAREPHIDSLIDFLLSCGADITRREESLVINGRELHGGKCTVEGDIIEAGSYLAAGLITGGGVKVDNCPTEQMRSVFDAFKSLGAEVSYDSNSATAFIDGEGKYCYLKATPYPGFPTDLQPIFAPLMASFSGGEIIDTVWESRFGYLNTLSAFKVNSSVCGNTAQIKKTHLIPASVSAPDLRGGMACLLSALSASGQSEIYSAEIILRGYENLIEKFSALGADIKIEDAKT